MGKNKLFSFQKISNALGIYHVNIVFQDSEIIIITFFKNTFKIPQNFFLQDVHYFSN